MENEGDLQRGLGRVEGKLDTVLTKLAEIGLLYNGLETRIRKVEAKLYYVSGGAAVAGFILSKIDYSILFATQKATDVIVKMPGAQ